MARTFVFPVEEEEARIYDVHIQTAAALTLSTDRFAESSGMSWDLKNGMRNAVIEFQREHGLDSDDVMRAYNQLRRKLGQ